MPEAESLYLFSVELNGCRNIRHLKIDLSPERPARFRHLILTGPNGSGKSGALLAIATELARAATDAVIASVPGAMVYDLERNVGTLSDEFRGVRYGTLMKEHFGIHEDFDQESQTDLEELRRLSALAALTPDEEEKLEALAARPGQPTRCDQDPVGPQSHPVATRSAAQTARIFSGPTLPT